MEKTFTSILALVVAVVAACTIMQNNRNIGTIYGAEWEYITIGDVSYTRTQNTNFTAADKDKRLGKVSNDAVEFVVYTVKGDEESKYLYCLWEYEGYFYMKDDMGGNHETD